MSLLAAWLSVTVAAFGQEGAPARQDSPPPAPPSQPGVRVQTAAPAPSPVAGPSPSVTSGDTAVAAETGETFYITAGSSQQSLISFRPPPPPPTLQASSPDLMLPEGQPFEVASSGMDFNSGTTRLHKIFGHDGKHYFVIKYHSGQYYLEELDGDMNLVLEEPIKLFEGLRTYDLETVVHFYDELYVFASRRRLSDVVLYYQKIDKATLRPSTDLTEITTVDFIKGNYADFHFALSRHESKLLVACRTKLLWSKVQFNEYYVFGEGLSLIWKRKDSFEYRGQGPRDNKYVVDDAGNVSILSLQKRESILSLISDVRNMYTIYRYTRQGEEFMEYPVTLEERYIRGIRIIGGDHGELICAGLYSEIFRTGMRGTFFFRIDPVSGRIYDMTMNAFDDSLLEQLADMKEPTIGQGQELIEYVITDLLVRENGMIIFIAEQFFNQMYNTYNNLIVVCLEPDGREFWSRVVQKNQDFNINTIGRMDVEPSDYRDYVIETGRLDSYAMNYCSYALMAPLDESSITLFFNDDIRNAEQTDKRKNFNRPRKSYIRSVTIDQYGNMSDLPVLAWKKRACFPEPIRYYDTLYNTIIIPASRNNKYNYYRLTLDYGSL